MSSIAQFFQPPLYWQQFEDLTQAVFRVVYDDPSPTKFGRPGQAQDGVDVFGHHGNNLIGIQCKRMDELDENNHPLPGGTITKKFIVDEIDKAKHFSPPLKIWILATTAKRDANVQRIALKLDQESRSKASFGIQVWFWDDFVTDLNRHHDLQRWYYGNVIQVQSSDDQDRIILDLLGEAFSRAAFRMPLHQETPADFIQALKDTQHAFSTGELKDRETRRVIRQAIGGRRAITSKPVAQSLREADDELHRLRELFQENLGTGIRQSGGVLMIDGQLRTRMEGHRRDAIQAVNRALTHAGLETI